MVSFFDSRFRVDVDYTACYNDDDLIEVTVDVTTRDYASNHQYTIIVDKFFSNKIKEIVRLSLQNLGLNKKK